MKLMQRKQTAPIKPTIIDRVVELFSPAMARRRLVSRIQLEQTRAYLAASPSDEWRPRRSTASANADHRADSGRLRAKSRALIQNVPYISAGMTVRAGLTVGQGIVPKFGGKYGEKLQALWNAQASSVSKGFDADGVMTVYGMQHLVASTLDVDGEVLVRVRPRRASDGLSSPVQFQVLEIDWLDTFRTDAWNGNQIIDGKEYDALGKCVAYWLFDQHPGEVVTLKSRIGRTDSKRVPAEYIYHIFAPSRPGAGRGFPRLSSVINDVRDMQLLQDAHAQRKNLEARLGALATGDLGSLDNAPKTEALESGASLGELSSGGITYVGAGMNITAFQPQSDGSFPEYLKLNLHLICAGAGFTFEQATGILTDTNFSSARIGGLNQRKELEHIQWHVLIPQLCDPVCHAFASAAAMAGKLGRNVVEIIPGRDYILEQSTPKWDYVNPKDEVGATIDEIGAGLTSFSEAMRRRGDDPQIRMAELASDIAGFKAAGIWEDILAMTTGSRQSPQPAGQEPANPTPKKEPKA